MNLFQLGDFTLASGARSSWKLECDAFSQGDWKALAKMIGLMVEPFGSVEGVPHGGSYLAEALGPFCSLNGPHLIVDDVLTTGGSMEKLRAEYQESKEQTMPAGALSPPVRSLPPKVVGAVVFARGQCPHWVRAVFQMPECFWVKPRTRGGD